MKTILLFLVLAGFTFNGSAQNLTSQTTARLKFKVTCFEGKLDSGPSGICSEPDTVSPGVVESIAITSSGMTNTLTWAFVGRNEGKDVYRFSFMRMTKAGVSGQTAASKEVQFDGKQVIIFQDDLYRVVMESPTEEDLKKAQGH
jgi:hypothetical protein